MTSKFNTVVLAFSQALWSAPVGGDTCVCITCEIRGELECNMSVCRLKRETYHSFSLGENLSGRPAGNKWLAALFHMVTTVRAWLWECRVNPLHHHVQPAALLILSDVLSVPQGGSHWGSAEESKQAVTSWSTEPVRGCFPFPINPLSLHCLSLVMLACVWNQCK